MGTFAHSTCDDRLRTIQNYHMDHQGWVDIAYSFVVCPHGYTFEGRGWGKRTAANGTNACNDAYHAVCYLGGDGDAFTSDAKLQFVSVRDEWNQRYGRTAQVIPHSACLSTACPGPVIREWISSGMGGVVPAPTGVTPMYDPPLDLINIVASLRSPDGGVWLLAQDGAIYAFGGAPYKGAANGQSYWGSRKAARLEANGGGYTIVATTGERYNYS